ncbi:50S ribosomal protein L19 [Deinococcus marmoris]|uniref:Large ribosomal subunit protein bL19 n=1 Tax=Deinococcus marmoris TaxID=249408 RepID=A0A1U7P2F6_9DEIO|nr:50S ribosomal protein L19 [Deinococcus marmoris]OLV19340.1 LSU ribosomal protein L19p [Deinococcus marmoris]
MSNIKVNRGAILRAVEQPHIKTDHPEFRPGDTVRVETKVVEGNRTRNQAFEGVVIALNGSGSRKSFTVRKISFGEGVERVFPFSSPLLAKVTVLERGKVRRAKLYYLRDLRGKAARIKSDRSRVMKDAEISKAARVSKQAADQAASAQAAEAAAAQAAAPAEAAPETQGE